MSMGNILCDVLWKCRRCRTGHAVSDYPVAFQNHAVALCGTHVRRAENKGCLVDLGRLGNRAPVLWEPRRNNSDVQQHLWFYRRMFLNIPGLWDPGQSIIHESFVSLFSTVSCACMNDFGGWPGLDADDQDVAAWFLARDLQACKACKACKEQVEPAQGRHGSPRRHVVFGQVATMNVQREKGIRRSSSEVSGGKCSLIFIISGFAFPEAIEEPVSFHFSSTSDLIMRGIAR